MVREPEEFPAELLPPPGSFLPTPKLPDDVEMEIMTQKKEKSQWNDQEEDVHVII